MKQGKRVTFSGKPTAKAADADDWVENRDRIIAEPKEATKRLTIDVSVSLHKRIKSQCALEDLVMCDVIRELLEQRFGEPKGQGPAS